MVGYTLEGPKWTTQTITWEFAPAADAAFIGAIGPDYQPIIEAAIGQWAAVTNLPIAHVAPGAPGVDITIGWGSLSGNQVGVTEFPQQNSATESFQAGTKIRIEDPSVLPLGPAPSATYQNTSTTLSEVALHEFGHALGLGHSSDPSAVMYPNLGPSNSTISATDLAGMDALYGFSTTPNALLSAPIANVDLEVSSQTSQAATPAAPGTIELTPTTVGVYRFFDSVNQTQFLTGSIDEANSAIATRPDLIYEGLAMGGILPTANDPNASPLYRFFDTTSGTHFLTANRLEETMINATRPDLILEPSSFYEHNSQQPGDTAVYRFFNSSNGTHFFTASASERATITASLTDMVDEGIAFYAPSLR